MQPDDGDLALGQALRRARVRAGLTQSEAAEALGVAFQQIQKYEKGASRMRVWFLVDLCRVLGTTPETVLHEARGRVDDAAGSEPAGDDTATLQLIALANRVDGRTRKAVIDLLRARATARGDEGT